MLVTVCIFNAKLINLMVIVSCSKKCIFFKKNFLFRKKIFCAADVPQVAPDRKTRIEMADILSFISDE